ncbi:MAG: inositol monophosphatase family protein [Mariprofundaceae bacterium]
MLYVAVRAARRAGDLLARLYDDRDGLSIEEKQDGDFVTEADRKAESTIIYEILKHYPNHGIVAEESGVRNPNAEIVWHIDPLDGTTNFIHGYPHFAVSIAAWKCGKPLIAVVHDPLRNETFEAKNGGGAFLNRRRLRVSPLIHIREAVFASGLPPYRRDQGAIFRKRLDVCIRETSGFRRGGSAALDLAYVAAGRLDAYWEAGLCSWDIAAGILLVQEAGGMATGLDGAPLDLKKGDVLVANPKLHDQFRYMLSSVKLEDSELTS